MKSYWRVSSFTKNVVYSRSNAFHYILFLLINRNKVCVDQDH